MTPFDFRFRLAATLCSIALVALISTCTSSGDTGDRVVVVPDSSSENVNLRLVFGYDAADCAAGSAWMLAKVIEGANTGPDGSLPPELRSLGVVIRARAEREALVIDIDIPKSSEDKTWPLLAGHLSQVISDGLAIDELRNSQHASLESLRSDTEWLATATYWSAVFQNAPYSLPPIGSDSAIEKLTVGDLEAFRRKFITSGNYVLGIAGPVGNGDGVSLDQILQKQLPSGNPAAVPKTATAISGLNVRIVDARDSQQATVLIAPPPMPQASDTASLILAMSAVLQAAQGGSLTGMDQALRIERGLSEWLSISTSDVQASTTGTTPRTVELTRTRNFVVRTETSAINALYAVRIILKVLSDLNSNGIAAEDIQRLSSIVMTSVGENTDARKRMHAQVAMRWMGTSIFESADKAGPAGPTSAKTRSVLRNLIEPTNLWIVMVVPDAANFRSAILGGTTAYVYPEWVDGSMIRRLDQEYLSYRPFWETEKIQVLHADSLFR